MRQRLNMFSWLRAWCTHIDAIALPMAMVCFSVNDEGYSPTAVVLMMAVVPSFGRPLSSSHSVPTRMASGTYAR